MGELKKWREQNWVRIGTDGAIKGECGTSKNKKNPDRCLPLAKARSLSKKDRSETAKKKKSSKKKATKKKATKKKGTKKKSSMKKSSHHKAWDAVANSPGRKQPKRKANKAVNYKY